MKPTDYAKIATALGISTDEAAGLEAEWREWHDFQSTKQELRACPGRLSARLDLIN